MKTKEIVLIGIFPALMAITAGISIPIGSVPITLQTMFVMLTGLILGKKMGFIAMTIYLILGMIGVPVFAGYQSGLSVILGPSGGFLLAFPFASFLVGFLNEKKQHILLSTFLGTVFIYIIGIPWMMYVLSWEVIPTISYMTVFFPGDVIKIAIVYILYKRIFIMKQERDTL